MTWTKSEAEKAYTQGAKDFDRWFYSLPPDQQELLRAKGVLPYREMAVTEYVFQVQPNAKAFHFNPWEEPERTEQDTFYSREKVREFVSLMLKSFSVSQSPEVRLHLELIKIALRMPDAMTCASLARITGMTRAGVNLQVQQIRAVMAGRRPAWHPKRLKLPILSKKAHATLEKRGFLPSKGGSKESPCRGGTSRVASHRGQKTRVSRGNSRGADR